MAVRSIYSGQYQTAGPADFVIFCLFAVGRLGSYFFFSCNEMSWDAVRSFLRLFFDRKYPMNTGV